LRGGRLDTVSDISYIVELLFALKDRLLAFVGCPEELSSRELRQDDMELQLVDECYQFIMDLFELAIA